MNAHSEIKAAPGAVYSAIAAITEAMGKEGISKGRRNQQQGYQFRGIEDVYKALNPLLAEHKLTIIPRVTERTVTERETQRGGVLFYVTVKSEFDFVSAEDGSVHTACTFGEAMDSADKATNKAMSAAYKYAAFMTFCIPTEGLQDDADAVTHEVAPRQRQPERKPGVSANLSDGFQTESAKMLHDQMMAAQTPDALKEWRKTNAEMLKALSEHDGTIMFDAYQQRLGRLTADVSRA